MAKARVEIVDDDVCLAALFGASGKFPGRVYLEKLGYLVSTNCYSKHSVEGWWYLIYLSAMLAVSLLFRVSNMLVLFLSVKGVQA